MTRRRRWASAVAVVIAALVGFRLYLPTLVLHVVNHKLQGIPGYQAHVRKVGVSLWRGAYQIYGMKVEKVQGEVPVPFFQTKVMDLSIEWSALLKRHIVGRMTLVEPQINFVAGPTDRTSQTSINSSWISKPQALMPVTLNRVDVENGEIHFRNFHSTPAVNIALTRIQATATDISTRLDPHDPLPTAVQVNADALGGTLRLDMRVNPLDPAPTFEMKESLRDADLRDMDDFFRAYGKVRVRKGTFSDYTEIAAKNGDFNGYTKPFLHGLKVKPESNKSVPLKIWAGIVSGVTSALTSRKNHAVATTVPISGNFGKPDIGLFAAVGGLLQNAFLRALGPSFSASFHLKLLDQGKKAPRPQACLLGPGRIACARPVFL